MNTTKRDERAAKGLEHLNKMHDDLCQDLSDLLDEFLDRCDDNDELALKEAEKDEEYQEMLAAEQLLARFLASFKKN